MKLFDVNVLIYAHRADQACHGLFRERLENELRQPAPCGLSAAVATGFVRIVTQPNFPNGPTPLPQALSVVAALTAPGACQWVHPGTRHWALLAELGQGVQASGKLVSDAAHAALAIEHGATWITRDSDFTRFTEFGLRLEKWEG